MASEDDKKSLIKHTSDLCKLSTDLFSCDKNEVDKLTDKQLDIIYNAFTTREIDKTVADDIICNYYGLCCYLDNLLDDAFKWFEMSARLGNKFGMYNLARCYHGNAYYPNGIGTKQDDVKAFELYKMSMDNGHPYAIDIMDTILLDKTTSAIRQMICDMIDKNKAFEEENKALGEVNKALKDVNEHLKLYPGSDFREAMNDFNKLKLK